jgi:eukaryotic-like serine/threonine-protein kinase
VTPAPPPPRAQPERRDLEWDEDELETQIYDQPGGMPAPAVAAGAARKKTGAFVSAPTAPALFGADSLDLAVKAGFGGPNAVETRPIVPPERPIAPPPRKAGRATANGAALSAPSFPAPREPSMTARGTIIPEISVRRPPAPGKIWLAMGAVAVAGLAVGGYWIFSGDSGTKPQAPAAAPAEVAAATASKPAEPPPAPLPVDPSSGFDITTDPPSGRVRLDGSEIGNAPLRVRSLLAGKHQLEVGLAGYQTSTQEITVEQGKALQLAVKLDKAAATTSVIKLTSDPAGAKVSLVENGAKTALGVTPAEAKLEPTKKYEALFELDGYAAVTRPIAAGDTAVAVALVKNGGPTVTPAPAPPPKEISAVPPQPPKKVVAPTPPKPKPHREPAPPPPRREPPPPTRREVAQATRAEPSEPPRPIETKPAPIPVEPRPLTPRETTPAVGGAMGHLTLGAKPPCTVLINGQDTGKTTPVKDLEVKSGTVSVTLVNGEFGIRESFTVTVGSGESKKVIKDFSDRLPK